MSVGVGLSVWPTAKLFVRGKFLKLVLLQPPRFEADVAPAGQMMPAFRCLSHKLPISATLANREHWILCFWPQNILLGWKFTIRVLEWKPPASHFPIKMCSLILNFWSIGPQLLTLW